jgi:coproporphyrinogen III oxidase
MRAPAQMARASSSSASNAPASMRAARRHCAVSTPLHLQRTVAREGGGKAASVVATAAAAAATPTTSTAAAAAKSASTQHGADAYPPAPLGQDDFAAFERFVVDSQDRIIREAEQLDGSGRTFLRDRWERSPSSNGGGGYGVTAVLEGGDLLEKAAANITVIRGTLTPQRAVAMSGRGRSQIDPRGGQPYSACALSLVFHPRNPHVPTLRADVRLFQVFNSAAAEGGEGQSGGGLGAPPLSWYGGGCDLTPALLYDEDARDFHAHWRAVCAMQGGEGGQGKGGAGGEGAEGNVGATLYSELKPWCDRYFYVTSRCEHRGVGGLFYDDLERAAAAPAGGGSAGAAAAAPASSSSSSPSSSGHQGLLGAPLSCAAARRGAFDPAAFSRDVLANVLPSWTAIAGRRRLAPVAESEREWQLVRRGRYLEFNLLDDRGVKFGLADGSGRVESIMVSAPPLVAWRYNVAPPPGSREEATSELLKGPPRAWV